MCEQCEMVSRISSSLKKIKGEGMWYWSNNPKLCIFANHANMVRILICGDCCICVSGISYTTHDVRMIFFNTRSNKSKMCVQNTLGILHRGPPAYASVSPPSAPLCGQHWLADPLACSHTRFVANTHYNYMYDIRYVNYVYTSAPLFTL